MQIHPRGAVILRTRRAGARARQVAQTAKAKARWSRRHSAWPDKQASAVANRSSANLSITFFALTFFYNIALSSLVLVVPLYLRHLGVTPVILGLAASLPPLVQLGLRLPSGAASDRLGERTVLLAAAGSMLVAAWLLVGAAQGQAAGFVIAALLLSGFSRAVYWPSAQSYASRMAGRDVTRTLGLFTSIGHIGAILAPPLAGALMVRWSFAAGFGLAMSGSLACIAFAWSLRRRPPQQPGEPRATGGEGFWRSLLAMTRSRPLLFSGLCMAGAAVPLALLSSFYPVYMADLGIREDAIGVLSSFRALTATVSSLALGVLGSRVPGAMIWLASAGLCGLGLGATAYLTSFAGLAAAMSVIGLSSGLLQVLSMTIATHASSPQNRAQAMAFTGIFFSITLWLVPLVMGGVAQRYGVQSGFAGLGLMWLVLAAALFGPARALIPPEPPAG